VPVSMPHKRSAGPRFVVWGPAPGLSFGAVPGLSFGAVPGLSFGAPAPNGTLGGSALSLARESARVMPYRRLVEWLFVSLGCVASGTLECGHRPLTEVEEHGRELYARMCAVCHGREGQGYAADQATALAHPDFLASATDAYLQSAIELGRSATTMSAWSTSRRGPLSPPDVQAVVAYIRTWQHKPNAVLDERPLAGVALRAETSYAAQCAACHGPRGVGGPYVRIGNSEFLSSAGNGFLRYAIQGGRSGTKMVGFEHVLGETGVEDVVALLRSWQFPALPPPAPAPVAPIPLGPVPLNPQGPAPVGFRPYPAVAPADVVKAQLDRGARMSLLDARAPSDYANEHIAGAVSVPFYDPDPYVPLLPKDSWIVCYCACPHAESGQLAQKLQAKGFTKVTVLDEGLGVWRMRKYPTHTGADP
jgi:cytochrome c oxidase cbb3-type subunit 3